MCADSGVQEVDTRGLYLYCLARRGLPTGVLRFDDGVQHAPERITYREVTGLVREEPVADWTGETGERNLRDLRWVGAQAGRHRKVLEAVSEYSPILPATLGTLFSERNVLLALIRQRHDSIVTFFDAVEGRDEWSLKIWLERNKACNRLSEHENAEAVRRLESLPPGARYLQERRLREAGESRVKDWMRDTCQVVVDELGAVATSFHQRKILPSLKAETTGEMVLNGAFLVSRELVEEFHNLVEGLKPRLDPRGVSLTLSGPWPPYSFAPDLGNDHREMETA